MVKKNRHNLPFGSRKVLVGGCFDILHFGHVHFLKEAKRTGDFLVVALESNKNTKKLKGQFRPIHNQKQRKEILESLKFVDKVIALPFMQDDVDYRKLVLRIKPDIIAITKGDLMKDKKKEYAALVDAKLVEIKKIKVPSTSQIAKILKIE